MNVTGFFFFAACVWAAGGFFFFFFSPLSPFVGGRNTMD
jgi:hypothetical protein